MSSRMQKRKSIKDVGLVPSGEGPFLVQGEDPSSDEHTESLHWATRIESTDDARLEDVEQSNPNVQLALKQGVPNCKLYLRKMLWHPECCQHLKMWGNRLNDVKTSTSPLEVWRSSSVVESTFRRKVQQNPGWTIAALGQSAYDAKKLSVAQALFHDERWTLYAHLERTIHFYKEATKLALRDRTTKSGDAGFFANLEERAMAEADLTQCTPATNEKLYLVCYDAMRVLKSDPDLLLDVVMMAFPKLGSTGWGAGPVLPNGLPRLKQVSESGLKSLLAPIGDKGADKAAELQMKEDAAKQKQKDNKAAGKAASKAKARVRGVQKVHLKTAGRSGGAAGNAALTPIMGDDKSAGDGEDVSVEAYDTYIASIRKEFDRLANLYPSMVRKIENFKLICIYVGVKDTVKLLVKGQPREFRGWVRLRVHLKNHINRSSALQPRPSDIDYLELMRPDADMEADIVPEPAQLSQESVCAMLTTKASEELVQFLNTNKIHEVQPPGMLAFAHAMQKTTMALFTTSPDRGVHGSHRFL